MEDLEKVGFKWDATLSDLDNRARKIDYVDESETYDYDINGDGVTEEIPFYSRPDGSSAIRNTVTSGTLAGAVSPAVSAATASTLNIAGKILENKDGDSIGLTFDFLDSLGESELLSAPRVTTMNP